MERNATANSEAAKGAAKRRIGSIMNNKLADIALKSIDMPKWLVLVGGRKWLHPIVKLVVANSGIFALGFMEAQGYKSSKAEFVADAMLEAGYDDLVSLINIENISGVVDKIIESVPANLFNEAEFNSETVNSANDFLNKAEPNVTDAPPDDKETKQ